MVCWFVLWVLIGVKQVFETDPDGNILDPRVSILYPSLGTTGYLISNPAGVAASYGALVRDWDRFDYWGMDDLEIDFCQSSLSWDYDTEELHLTVDGDACYAPFAIYRHIFSSAEVQRLFAGFRDSDEDGTWNMPMTEGEYDWVDPSWGRPCYEPIYCWVGYDAEGNEINYDPSNDAQYIGDNDLRISAHLPESDAGGRFPNPYVTDMLFCMYTDDATPPWGNMVYFRMNKPNTPNDIFSFTAPPAPVILEELLKADLEKINVVPNPYYAFHSQEHSVDEHWVQFTYLPERCTIWIFDLAGNVVRKLEKNDASTPFLRWDLTSQWDYPLASGVYVYLVEVPGIGVRHGKLAIFRSQEYLPVY